MSLNSKLQSLESTGTSLSSGEKKQSKHPLEAVLDLVKVEKENLKTYIEQLEASSEDLGHKIEHLKSQANEQVAAIEEEEKKIAMSSEVCML